MNYILIKIQKKHYFKSNFKFCLNKCKKKKIKIKKSFNSTSNSNRTSKTLSPNNTIKN